MGLYLAPNRIYDFKMLMLEECELVRPAGQPRMACSENRGAAEAQVGALRQSAQVSAAARRTRLAPASSLYSNIWVS